MILQGLGIIMILFSVFLLGEVHKHGFEDQLMYLHCGAVLLVGLVLLQL